MKITVERQQGQPLYEMICYGSVKAIAAAKYKFPAEVLSINFLWTRERSRPLHPSKTG